MQTQHSSEGGGAPRPEEGEEMMQVNILLVSVSLGAISDLKSRSPSS